MSDSAWRILSENHRVKGRDRGRHRGQRTKEWDKERSRLERDGERNRLIEIETG